MREGYFNGFDFLLGKLFLNEQLVFDGNFENGIPKEYEFKVITEQISHIDVSRNPENYIGQAVTFRGRIQQVIEGDDGNVGYLISDGLNSFETFYVGYIRMPGASRVLEDDVVTVWGYSTGLITYQSVGHGPITVPAIFAYFIDVD